MWKRLIYLFIVSGNIYTLHTYRFYIFISCLTFRLFICLYVIRIGNWTEPAQFGSVWLGAWFFMLGLSQSKTRLSSVCLNLTELNVCSVRPAQSYVAYKICISGLISSICTLQFNLKLFCLIGWPKVTGMNSIGQNHLRAAFFSPLFCLGIHSTVFLWTVH